MQNPAGPGGSNTGTTMNHRNGRTPLSHARASPSKSTLKPRAVSREQSADETSGFNPGLLTPPSSQILDNDDDDFISHKASKNADKTPVRY